MKKEFYYYRVYQVIAIYPKIMFKGHGNTTKEYFEKINSDNCPSYYFRTTISVQFQNLSLRSGDLLDIDSRHCIPTRISVSVSVSVTVTDPESHAHLAFVDAVTVTLDMADTVRI